MAIVNPLYNFSRRVTSYYDDILLSNVNPICELRHTNTKMRNWNAPTSFDTPLLEKLWGPNYKLYFYFGNCATLLFQKTINQTTKTPNRIESRERIETRVRIISWRRNGARGRRRCAGRRACPLRGARARPRRCR